MSKELTLFKYTQPELMAGLTTHTRKNEAGVPIAISLTMLKRKEVAQKYNLNVKGEATTAKLLQLSDVMKQTAVAEFVKMAASNDFTGAGMTVRQLKDGRLKVNAGLISVQREAKTISPDQLAKALAAMTDEQRTAILGKAEALAAEPDALDVETSVAAAPAQTSA